MAPLSPEALKNLCVLGNFVMADGRQVHIVDAVIKAKVELELSANLSAVTAQANGTLKALGPEFAMNVAKQGGPAAVKDWATLQDARAALGQEALALSGNRSVDLERQFLTESGGPGAASVLALATPSTDQTLPLAASLRSTQQRVDSILERVFRHVANLADAEQVQTSHRDAPADVQARIAADLVAQKPFAQMVSEEHIHYLKSDPAALARYVAKAQADILQPLLDQHLFGADPTPQMMSWLSEDLLAGMNSEVLRADVAHRIATLPWSPNPNVKVQLAPQNATPAQKYNFYMRIVAGSADPRIIGDRPIFLAIRGMNLGSRLEHPTVVTTTYDDTLVMLKNGMATELPVTTVPGQLSTSATYEPLGRVGIIQDGVYAIVDVGQHMGFEAGLIETVNKDYTATGNQNLPSQYSSGDGTFPAQVNGIANEVELHAGQDDQTTSTVECFNFRPSDAGAVTPFFGHGIVLVLVNAN